MADHAHPDNHATPLLYAPSVMRKVFATFDEPDMTSDGGCIILRQATQHGSLIDRLADAINDSRSSAHVSHSVRDMLAQRIGQICLGYEDANDCDHMREDWAIQLLADQHRPLASQPTMTRLENRVTQDDLANMEAAIMTNFLDSYTAVPKCLVIDMDPSAIRTYGQQELSLYNTHIGGYCLMPFHVYEGLSGKLITTIIREGKTPTADEIIPLLERIVRAIRSRFPKATLIFRADSHHTKPAVMDYMARHNIRFVTGLSTNARLKKLIATEVAAAEAVYERRKMVSKYRRFHSFRYKADSWSEQRRVVARIEVGPFGTDVRFVVTDLPSSSSKALYQIYCGRGEAELYIKAHKCLNSERSSCQAATANQFRLLLHSAAYAIMHSFRATALAGTKWAKASFSTIRCRLFKLAARVESGKTYLRLHFSEKVDPSIKAIFARVSALHVALTNAGHPQPG